MPIPLSLAFWAMDATKRFHASPVYKRPFQLRTIYFARLGGYLFTGLVVFVGQNKISQEFGSDPMDPGLHV